MLTPGVYGFTIYQGATFDRTFTWTAPDNMDVQQPVDLTGYTARMQLRPKAGSPIDLLSLTTANGGIILGDALGTIRVIITASQTAVLTFRAAVYDLELAIGSEVDRLLMGKVKLSKEVTV